MRKILMLASIIVALTGCASKPTLEELAKADYGLKTPQDRCEAIVKSKAQAFLKDGDSAKYKFGRCEKRGLPSFPLMQLPKQYGYLLPVQINAKNSYGAYIGYEHYEFLLKNGNIIRKSKFNKEYGVMFPF